MIYLLAPGIVLGLVFSSLLIFGSDIAVKVLGEKFRLSRQTFLLISAILALLMIVASYLASSYPPDFGWFLLIVLGFIVVCFGASLLLPTKAQIVSDLITEQPGVTSSANQTLAAQ